MSEDAEVARLRAALEAAQEEVAVANDTLDAWFNRRKLAHDWIDDAVLDATRSYLRTCRSGGMPAKVSNHVEAAVGEMARLGIFADLFARAAMQSEAISCENGVNSEQGKGASEKKPSPFIGLPLSDGTWI